MPEENRKERQPMDCTDALRLIWRGDIAAFNSYVHHAPDMVVEIVLSRIESLIARAEQLEEWLSAYIEQGKAEGESDNA